MRTSHILLLPLAAAFFVGGLWISVDAFCQCVDDPVGVTVLPGSQLDAGAFPVGQSPQVEFRVRNTSCGNIKLVGLDTGCGCTQGKMSQQELDRGEEAIITLQMNARKSPGPFGIAATLRYSKGDSHSLQSVLLRAGGRFEQSP
ncbi:MAG: DUF1573 domain-containing protein [Planctomycetaceae bacterium]